MFVLLLISLLEAQYPKLIPSKGAIFVNLNEHFPNAHYRIPSTCDDIGRRDVYACVKPCNSAQ